MKRVIAGTFAATAFAVGLSAQAPPQATPMQEGKDTAKSVTVTGCLKAGEGTDSFLLSDLKWSKDKTVGTAGAVTPAAPAMGATSLKLVAASPSAKLSDHIGHTVEVSGTVGDKAGKDKATTDPAARPASTQASLNVTNLKMISATCSAQ